MSSFVSTLDRCAHMEKYLLGKTSFFKEYLKIQIVVNETINRSDIVLKAVNKFLLF